MRKLSITRIILVVLIIVVGILEIADVISIIGEPVVRYCIYGGLLLMLAYQLFEAKQKEKNQTDQ
ncbi:hypothetical protein [Alkalicoccobacillus gibsonii]|uniref:hypothetical protein n=1 Tax=Alkalicoccobacillus gibsonii TaxID=79881 RepID=UPI001934621A|nr:hypothetical protein [Alkalicoccobacillus gibsonii]MBM0065948.1 hypothetical protein [Alkalicoccobacillus gibsonii]